MFCKLVSTKRVCILIILFVSLLVYGQKLDFIFIPVGFDDISKKDEVIESFIREIKTFNPICNYIDYLNFVIYDKEHSKSMVKINNNNFLLDETLFLDITRNIPHNKYSQFVIVVNSEIKRAKGGVVDDKSLIIISSSAKKRTILHEIGHSLFKLGDEYSGILTFLPSEREISKYKNLTLSTYNEEWERIKELVGDDKIGYYEGGLERSRGVYHSYPECLMKSVESDLCPVCLYYVDMILRAY